MAFVARFAASAVCLATLASAASQLGRCTTASHGTAHLLSAGRGEAASNGSICVCAQGSRCVFGGTEERPGPSCGHGIVQTGDGLFDRQDGLPRRRGPYCRGGGQQEQRQPLRAADSLLSPLHRRFPEDCTACRCEEGKAANPRIIFASVPRSGNGWMRLLIERATGRATESVFNEKFMSGPPQQRTQKTSSQSAQTDLFGHRCGLLGDCDRVVRASDQESVVVKTHSPFLISTHSPYAAAAPGDPPVSDAGVGAFALLAVRNPLDNYNAWVRYEEARGNRSAHKHRTLDDFLDAWSHHHLCVSGILGAWASACILLPGTALAL